MGILGEQGDLALLFKKLATLRTSQNPSFPFAPTQLDFTIDGD
jgi:hypothetical protein